MQASPNLQLGSSRYMLFALQAWSTFSSCKQHTVQRMAWLFKWLHVWRLPVACRPKELGHGAL